MQSQSYLYRIETALNFVWPVAKTFPPNKIVLATELLDSVPDAYCLYTSAIRCTSSVLPLLQNDEKLRYIPCPF